MDINDLNSRADGGPIHPVSMGSMPNQYAYAAGVSLRDWFAGQAMVGLLACPGQPNLGYETVEEYAAHYSRTAYLYADVMLAARSPKQEG
jgi:hypothetical protein